MLLEHSVSNELWRLQEMVTISVVNEEGKDTEVGEVEIMLQRQQQQHLSATLKRIQLAMHQSWLEMLVSRIMGTYSTSVTTSDADDTTTMHPLSITTTTTVQTTAANTTSVTSQT
jgi:hypothetical protein